MDIRITAMRGLVAASLLLVALVPGRAAAGTTESIGEIKIEEARGTMSFGSPSLWVYVDAKGALYLKLDGIHRGYVPPDRLAELADIVRRGLGWAQRAEAEKIEFSRPLGDLRYKTELLQAGVNLNFFSHSGSGRFVCYLSIEIIDFDNEFMQAKAVLTAAQAAELLKLIEQAPTAIAAARAKDSRASDIVAGRVSPPSGVDNTGTPVTEAPAVTAMLVAASQKRAVEKFPALIVAGSAHNLAFVARVKELRAESNVLLRVPSWPEMVAEETRPTATAAR